MIRVCLKLLESIIIHLVNHRKYMEGGILYLKIVSINILLKLIKKNNYIN